METLLQKKRDHAKVINAHASYHSPIQFGSPHDGMRKYELRKTLSALHAIYQQFPKHCLFPLQPNGHLSERTDNFCEVQAQRWFHRSHLLPEVNVPVVPVLKMPLSSTCSDPVGDPKLCRLSCFSMRSNRRFTLLLALFRIPRSESVCHG